MLFEEKEITIFTDFTDEEKNKFLSICDIEECKKDETILEEGQITRALFIIKEGSVRISLNFDGEEFEIVKLIKDDFFGEMSFLDGKLHSATVKTSDDSELYIIRKLKFDLFAKKNPAIAQKFYENIIRTLVCRLRHSDDIIKNLNKEK
jgi:CRP-like cAMP-binding protein